MDKGDEKLDKMDEDTEKEINDFLSPDEQKWIDLYITGWNKDGAGVLCIDIEKNEHNYVQIQDVTPQEMKLKLISDIAADMRNNIYSVYYLIYTSTKHGTIVRKEVEKVERPLSLEA